MSGIPATLTDNTMNDLFGYNIDKAMKLTELQRELDRRRSVYSGQVKKGYLGLSEARHRLAVFQSIINDYNQVKEATPQLEPDVTQCHMSTSAAEALAEIKRQLEI